MAKFQVCTIGILVSRNPKAFFSTHIEYTHVKFISASGIQFKLCNFSSWQVPFKLWTGAEGSITFAKDVISHSVADKENSKSLTSLSKIILGAIMTDLWGERIKHVKRGQRNGVFWLQSNPHNGEGNWKRFELLVVGNGETVFTLFFSMHKVYISIKFNYRENE